MAFQGDAIFWVDTDKVVPNPFQPRREFDQSKLQELSESIRMYGVLQPLTVTRSEVQNEDGTFYTQYELIAGERRLRASRLASIAQVPVIIREGEQSQQEKLELAIIENLQREDLNAIDRALAFQQLVDEFDMPHAQVAQKVGRSREYVSNSIRLLGLPEHIRTALQRGELGEGHARTLLMLTDRPQEQDTLFREILLKKMSVREVERIVRKIAVDKVRKPHAHDIGDSLLEFEKEFTETLGTRVQIQKTEFGGKLTIDYFSEEDLTAILKRMQAEAEATPLTASVAAMASLTAATALQQSETVKVAEAQQSTPLQTANEPTQVPAAAAEPQSGVSASPANQSLVPRPAAAEAPLVDITPTSEPPVPTAPSPIQSVTEMPEPFGFIRPQPAHEPTVAQHQTESSTPVEPQPTGPAETQPEEPVAAEPQVSAQPQPSEPDEDMYSVRNFSI